jgi:hypothetical protein
MPKRRARASVNGEREQQEKPKVWTNEKNEKKKIE